VFLRVAQPDGLLVLSNDPPFDLLIVFRDCICLAHPPEADSAAGVSEGHKPIPPMPAPGCAREAMDSLRITWPAGSKPIVCKSHSFTKVSDFGNPLPALPLLEAEFAPPPRCANFCHKILTEPASRGLDSKSVRGSTPGFFGFATPHRRSSSGAVGGSAVRELSFQEYFSKHHTACRPSRQPIFFPSS
jgi:hypothetical protein